MKKFLFCFSLVLTGLLSSCIDKNEEVDAESRPDWLGESIYAELKNPTERNLLSGTFNNYLRLIDDLGYNEVLNRTGSKTIFPANDEAFERFFKSNEWNVSSYEQLSLTQKKLLLYSSMLDNSMLIGMLPNVSNGTNEPLKGQALRHATNVKTIDSIQFIPGTGQDLIRPEQIPANNVYWNKFYNKGIHIVSDATVPMMVHLTREYMLNNGIKTTGNNSDFAILTGEPFTAGTAYLFNDRVVKGDVTCQNGYIHQMQNVIVPPGNMAQVIREKSNTKLFSRILDYFAAPYYNATVTQNYNDWAKVNGKEPIDSIFEMRYMSLRSQNEQLIRDPNRQVLSGSQVLSFDPGWNHYYPKPARQSTGIDYEIMDMGAVFAPSDDAVKQYFLPGGAGAYLIDIYGDKPNTADNLTENIDSLHSKNPQVLTAFAKNLMKSSFAATVPSKFETITNDASENMGMNLGLLIQKEDGKYDITIANNGAVYVINKLLAPDEYLAVLAPASVYPDMKVMNWAVQDAGENSYLGVDFKYYLLAMSATYAFFIPDDMAFDLYYLDPASLGHEDNGQVGTQLPDVLHFYYDTQAKSQPYLACDRHYYNVETGEIDPTPRKVKISEVKTQMVDILNYHTLVLDDKEVIGKNHYYKTKHGGEVYVDGDVVGGRVMSGAQIDNPERFPAPVIKVIHNQDNGHAYRLDRVIQPPIVSVYGVLSENKQFSEFLEACMGFGASEILAWAGIAKEPKQTGMPSPQDAFTIFTRDYKLGTNSIQEACFDYNVKMFNTYNYTLFAPDNTAMQIAQSQGLPKWEDIQALFMKYSELEGDHEVTDEEEADKARAYLMIKSLRDFVRFHFTSNSVYADNIVDGGRMQTLSTDEMGVAKELRLSGGSGVLTISDKKSGHSVNVDANSSSKMVNQMARDYWLDNIKTKATGITTSSFCAIHQISEPLYGDETGRFDGAWASRSAFQKAMRAYKTKKANNEL